MSAEPRLTIVSAADRRFLWGLYLLAASVARANMPVRFVAMIKDFSEADRQLIDQFPHSSTFEFSADNPRNPTNRKAEVFSKAETEFIAWLDADCVLTGDCYQELIPENGDSIFRFRGPDELAYSCMRVARPEDPHGEMPRHVLETWRQDVGERAEPRFPSTVSANCFVIHRKHLPFIEKWGGQIQKVVSAEDRGVVDHGRPAYWMTDESVLNSVLLFSHDAPDPAPYRLDHLDGAHVAHFGLYPKPWMRWTKRAIPYLPFLLDLIDWAKESGYATPEVPPSLQRQRRWIAPLEANAINLYQTSRTRAGRLLRGMGLVS